jgi:YcaO-like protein with predicted kinase domain
MQNFSIGKEANKFNLLSQLSASRKEEALSSLLAYYRTVKLLSHYGHFKEPFTITSCAIFNDAELNKAYENLAASNTRLMPVKEIIIQKDIFNQEDFAATYKEFAEHIKAICYFQNNFNLTVKVEFNLYNFDDELALKNSELLLKNNIAGITFIFKFPPLTPKQAENIKAQLKRFSLNPIISASKVSFKNFPFCFIAPNQFKQLYREIVKPFKGKVELQRRLLKQLQNKAYQFLKPCRNCRAQIACYEYTEIAHHLEYAPLLAPRKQSTLVFVGASLTSKDYLKDPDMLYTTPAEQGDMLAAILEGFKTILIIDGYFYHKYPCTPLEVLLALEQGIAVFGSSSIGALRAVELDNYGMQGVGYVYEYLKKFKVKPYHIVAQLYDEHNQPLSLPLVDIIYFLEQARQDGIINPTEYRRALKAAQQIDFIFLSFERFFKQLDALLSSKLNRYWAFKGKDYFNIKCKDAQKLLKEFKDSITARSPAYTGNTFAAAQEKYLKRLFKKYDLSFDRTLPKGWKQVPEVKISSYTRDHREAHSPQETCRLAARYFKNLDVIFSDTSRYDPFSHNYIINIYFPALYFLDYYLSSAFGNGDIYEEALVSAYMELIERIPMMSFPFKALPLNQVSGTTFPISQLPQFYNWDIPSRRKIKIFNQAGYLKVTDIINENEYFIPKLIALGSTSGSDGNASGNTLVEAVLYGIFEDIERDIVRTYNAVNNSLQSRLVIDLKEVKDLRSKVLIKEFEAKACKVLLLNLLNIYDLPCVCCLILDFNNRIIRKGGIAVRTDFSKAISAALLEAFSLYLVDFTGGRDDYVSLIEESQNYEFKRFNLAYAHFFEHPQYITIDPTEVKFNSLQEELDFVITKLTKAGITHILVANQSPLEKYKLKSVKVIIPGTELVFIEPYKPSAFYKNKVKKTLKLIQGAQAG